MKAALAVLASLPILAVLSVLSVRARKWRESAWLDGAPRNRVDEVHSDSPDVRPGEWTQATKSAYRVARGVIDRALAFAALVVLSPILAIIAIAIRLDSPGPVLFTQLRVGKSGRPFTMMKFRTLDADAPRYSQKLQSQDVRITRVGGFLRRTGLDECPQLWNVLRGDMALIGPRPEQAELIDLYEPWQREREKVLPGITGWWQIHHRDGVPLHKNVDKDLYYIDHQGPWLDLLIVRATLRIMFGALLNGSSAVATALEVPAVDALAEETAGV